MQDKVLGHELKDWLPMEPGMALNVRVSQDCIWTY